MSNKMRVLFGSRPSNELSYISHIIRYFLNIVAQGMFVVHYLTLPLVYGLRSRVSISQDLYSVYFGEPASVSPVCLRLVLLLLHASLCLLNCFVMVLSTYLESIFTNGVVIFVDNFLEISCKLA